MDDITNIFLKDTESKETYNPINQHKINPNISKTTHPIFYILGIIFAIPLIPIILGTIIILSPIIISIQAGKCGLKLIKNFPEIKRKCSQFFNRIKKNREYCKRFDKNINVKIIY